MKKTAYSTLLILLLFLVESQVMMVLANPKPSPWGHPEIIVISPVQNGTFLQNNVWLNLTVTKPAQWVEFEGQLEYVAYYIDGDRMSLVGSYYDSKGEIRVAIEDPLGVVNPPLEFNFTIRLTGLSEGNHHVDFAVYGVVKDGEIVMPVGRIYANTTYFTVTAESSAFSTTPTPSSNSTSTPTLSPEPTLTSDQTSFGPPIPPLSMQLQVIAGAVIIVAVMGAGLGLLIYLIKRK